MKKNKDYMFQTKIDSRTDFEKGIYYKTCEGKDVATMEVMQYNQMFYESMMIKKERKPSENKDDMSR